MNVLFLVFNETVILAIVYIALLWLARDIGYLYGYRYGDQAEKKVRHHGTLLGALALMVVCLFELFIWSRYDYTTLCAVVAWVFVLLLVTGVYGHLLIRLVAIPSAKEGSSDYRRRREAYEQWSLDHPGDPYGPHE